MIRYEIKFGSFGQQDHPGLNKLVEENGEAQTVIGKIQGLGHMGDHWDGRRAFERKT